MKPKNLLLFFILTLLSLGCKKEESSFTEISGQVYEYGTNQPIPYAKVRFEWWDPKTYGEIKHLVDSSTTDANGFYQVSGDIPVDKEYYVIANAREHFEMDQVERLRPNVKRGIKQNKNLNVVPFAWARFVVHKSGQHNNLEIGPIPGSSKSYQVISDTTFVSNPIFGNKDLSFFLFKYKNGLQETEEIFFTSSGGDTSTINISF